ncbi:MAG: YraN family protein [Bacteroidales bacterium]
MKSAELGKQGEIEAQKFLIAKGFHIRHTNWRWGHKELDIVAENGNNLHIVEVKTRSAQYLVPPSNSVNRQKQMHTITAANIYIEKFSLNLNVQFDIISIVISGKSIKIEYIPEAFYPIA